MSTPADKIKYLNETKAAIKEAIVAKGVAVADDATFRSYADSIEAIEGPLPQQEKTIEITANGSYEVTPDEGYVISKAVATVNVEPSLDGLVEPIVLSGACNYACSGALGQAYMDLFGDTITTSEILDASNMFLGYNGTTIPFEINLANSSRLMPNIFKDCKNLTSLPKINGLLNMPTSTYTLLSCDDMFQSCQKLREIPDDYFSFLPEGYIEAKKSYKGNGTDYLCSNLESLRKSPSKDILKIFANYGGTYTFYSCYPAMFNSCTSLDEAVNIPVEIINYTGNAFTNTFNNCSRVKNIIFETNEDGSPIEVQWKSQTIDLTSNYFGRTQGTAWLIRWNNGITEDKKVTDDATYQALKDDADWYADTESYSRYNHDSAVATINSLPDTSAYLATAGGTNTIKFKGAAGSATDGGAINTLTEEEIAVATAKGWTVTLV